MHYRRFGQTGLDLSVFSLGTMRYLASEENACRTVAAAIEAGINHIETARGYGQSEVFLGKALARLGVDRTTLFLTTKLTPTQDAATTQEWLAASLERLGTDYLDTLALHGVNTWEHLRAIQSETGCMQVLRSAREQGIIRHLGFSTHGPLELILGAIETGLFEFVNLHYTYFFQRNAPAIALAHARKMGVFIISPADKGGQLFTPPAQLSSLCHPLTPLGLNYRFLLSDPRITTLSLGAAQAHELVLPLQWADRTDPLTPEEQEILTRLDQHQHQVLGSDRCAQCYQCLPCPEEIHIPEVLRLRNLAVAYEMVSFGQYRYQMFENAGHWFPGMKANRCTDCGDCLPRCPEQLAIPDLLRDTHDRLKGSSRRRLWG